MVQPSGCVVVPGAIARRDVERHIETAGYFIEDHFGKLPEARWRLLGLNLAKLPSARQHGGHPAFFASPGGGFVDTWGIDPGPGWTFVGMMRYRSRRDLIQLVTDDAFTDAHAFKRAAMPITCSFPLRKIRFFTSPRTLVGLALALAAALAHLALAACR
jgi:hypothetical protein